MLFGGIFAFFLGVFVLLGCFFVFRASARFFCGGYFFKAYHTKTGNFRSGTLGNSCTAFKYRSGSLTSRIVPNGSPSKNNVGRILLVMHDYVVRMTIVSVVLTTALHILTTPCTHAMGEL